MLLTVQLSYRIWAIKVTAGSPKALSSETELSGAQLAALGTAWTFANNLNDYTISDRTSTHLGYGGCSVIINAPHLAGKRVARVKYRLRVLHSYPGDLTLLVGRDARYLNVWNRLGGANDGGYDDDPETNADVFLHRWEDHFFDGLPVNGSWYLQAYDWSPNDTGTIDYFELWIYYATEEAWSQGWGAPGDIVVPGDWDGDGRGDLIVWRPSLGKWYVLSSVSSYTSYWTWVWGAAGDTPLMGDLDGDGKGDLVVWRGNTGTWYILYSSKGYNYGDAKTYVWGMKWDIPLLVDTNGDGRMDLTVYRPSTGRWYFRTLPPLAHG
ncbi:MAG: hypothetical protein FJZ90_13125 [Chloroflexi bacterium]|nr:hypothetical protein [Chloroflexota bacterium]